MSSMVAPPMTQHLNGASSSQSQATPRPSRSPQATNPSPGSSPRAPSPRGGSSGTIDVEAVLRASGGNVKRALEVMVLERNNLQAQNSQLWKLIEKQRAQSAHLNADNERLRSDRERANTKLAAAGLEPVNGKRIPNSSSAVGLGLRPEVPQIRRHNSDREEKSPKPTLQVPLINNSAPASHTDETPPATFLPSPIPEPKLRRESRMAFPSEVTSFMTLAESPRDATHGTTPNVPASWSNNTLSPASQYSPSPSQNGREEVSGRTAPASSRALAVTTEVEEEEEDTGRHHRSRNGSLAFPPLRKSSLSPEEQKTAIVPPAPPLEEMPRPSYETSSPRASQDMDTPRATRDPQPSQEKFDLPFRSLPSLGPALLPHTRLAIPTSTVHTNSLGRDVLSFIISISVRPPTAQSSSWNVAKLFSAFIDLDTKIKSRSGKGRKEWKSMVAPLPDGRAWKDFAPSKIDQRRKAIEAYLQSLLVAPIRDKTDLCEFLTTDPVQNKMESARKEGYLTKKGKNFGGWKRRFFVLEGPMVKYFETRGGAVLGSIVITNAQIGRQNRPSESTDERDFRHAFLIIEATKKGTTNRHVLCADSDTERDSWIEALVKHVDPEPASQPAGVSRHRSNSRMSSKDVFVTASQPLAGAGIITADSKFTGAPSPSLFNSMESKRTIPSSSSGPSLPHEVPQEKIENQASGPSRGNASISISSISRPVTMVTSPSTEILSSSPPSAPIPRAGKRQSAMPIRQSFSPAYLSKVASEGMSLPPGYNPERDRDRKAKSGRFWHNFGKTPEKASRPVFGVSVIDSVAIASLANLPAIAFRCIEYLEAKKAEQEEGIYRLSGSSAVIKGLRDRFDAEGDVNLLAVDEHWDPHAIAGLLKAYLRELPTSLLTHDLHLRFLAVMDLIDISARVAELSRLVSDLPPPNYALLRALTAHLILIVRNAPTNKMTLRNIGIVFSPTLGIPAGIFSELVTHFGAIFDDAGEEEAEVSEEQTGWSVPSDDVDETMTRKRNSMLYKAGGADLMLGLGGRSLDPVDDSASEASIDDVESEAPSVASSENLSISASPVTPRAEGYVTETPARRAKSAARVAERGSAVETPSHGGRPKNTEPIWRSADES